MFNTPNIWAALSDAATNGIFWSAVNAGAPTSGTSGTGANICGPGSLLIDYTNKVLYINTNTKASPTWTAVGGSGGGGVTLNGVQTLTNKTLTSPVLTTPAIGAATGASVVLTGDCKAATFHAGSAAGVDGGPFSSVTGITVVKGIITAITGT